MNDSLRPSTTITQRMLLIPLSVVFVVLLAVGILWFGHEFVKPVYPWMFTTDACPSSELTCGQPMIYPTLAMLPLALVTLHVLLYRERLQSSE